MLVECRDYGSLYTTGGNVKWYSYSRKHFGSFLRKLDLHETYLHIP